MSEKRMLADVLWEAANVHLSPDGWWSPATSNWSCNAVAKAVTGNADAVAAAIPNSQAIKFLRSLGCQTGKENYTFGQTREIERQGVRYMWLLLAMHVAAEEGIAL